MALKAGINGFGRIGRNVFRAAHARGADIDWVGVNDLTDPKTLAHLLKYDSILGPFEGEIDFTDDSLIVDGDELKVFAERDPAALPWGDVGADVVIESTGLLHQARRRRQAPRGRREEGHHQRARDRAGRDARAGRERRRVRPGPAPRDLERVVHHELPRARSRRVLHDSVGIERGIMTTIHAYTADQNLQDGPHKDLRRARAAAANLVPTSTGAAKAIGLVVPELDGKLNGIAVRAPVITGSVVDLVFEPSRATSAEEVNAAFAEKADSGAFEGILKYSEDPIVSSDIVTSSYSSVFDAPLTMVIDEKLVKVVAWYDNEWGYSNRVVDLAQRVLAGSPVA